MTHRPEVVCAAACIVGESPVWMPERRELAMVDVHGRRVRRISWDSGEARDFVMREQVGAVVPDGADGNLLVKTPRGPTYIYHVTLEVVRQL